MRVSIPGGELAATSEIADYLATVPEPTYGKQLQDFSLAGHTSEYSLEIDYTDIEIALSGARGRCCASRFIGLPIWDTGPGIARLGSAPGWCRK